MPRCSSGDRAETGWPSLRKMAQHSHTTWKISKPRTSSCLTLTPPSPMLLAEPPSGFGLELCLPPDVSQHLAVLELVLATCARGLFLGMVGQHWPGWPPGSSSPGEGHTLPQPQDGLSLSLCTDDGSHTPLLSNYCLHAPAHGLLSSVGLGPCFCHCVLILCTQSQSGSWPGEPHSWGSLEASKPWGMSLPVLLTAEHQPRGHRMFWSGEAWGGRRK